MNNISSVVSKSRLGDIVLCTVLICTALVLAQYLYSTSRETSISVDVPPVLLPYEGLYRAEEFVDRVGFYRWTEDQSEIHLPNPGGTIRITITFVGGPEGATPVQLRAGDTTLDLTVRPELRIYSLALPPTMGERLVVSIESPTVRLNKRDIGIVVSDIAVAGGGAAPSMLLLALVVATVGGYTLLRQIQLRAWVVVGIILILQIIVIFWQTSIGWQYGLLSQLLLVLGGGALFAVVLERIWSATIPTNTNTLVLSRVDMYALLMVLVAALAVQIPWLAARDPVGDLELAARRMWFLNNESLAGAYLNGGDYMPLRLYILYGLSALVEPLGGTFHDPLPPITMFLIKLPSLLANLVTTAIIFVWSRHWCTTRLSATIGALYALAPPVWINIAWWGQVDALLMLPLLMAVVVFDHAGGRWSWLCWTAALLIKAQAILLAPLIVVVTLRRYGCKGLVQGVSLAFGFVLIASIPFILAGQSPGLLEAYLGSVERFPRTNYNAYNLWYLALAGDSIPDHWYAMGTITYRQIGIVMLAIATALICLALFLRSDGYARANAAAALGLAFFTLPTQIHERYQFLTLAFVALCIAINPRFALLFLVLAFNATLNIIGTLNGFMPLIHYQIKESFIPLLLSVINLIALAVVIGHLLWISLPTRACFTRLTSAPAHEH